MLNTIMKRTVVTPFVIVTLLIGSAFMMTSCASQQGQQGAAVGAGLGAVTGALLDSKNRWRGAALGAAIGGVFGGTLGEISNQAAREAAREGRPVVYESEDGYRRVEAAPQSYNAQTNCHKVRERVWEDGVLVKDQVREICEADRTEPGYM